MENCQRVQIWEWQNPPPPNENCQRVQIQEFQNTPILNLVQNTPLPNEKLSESSNLRVAEYPPSPHPSLPKMKNCQRVQIQEFQNTPILNLVQNTPPPKKKKLDKTSVFKLQNCLKIREIYVETM